ncbi:MAG: methyltransferase domain-containing protein [Chromatiales bacterium]|nr:methyltransferase domain-containing protein [Chromatiales bacterium]
MGDHLSIDQARVRSSFARAAGGYDSADILQTEVRERLLERLDPVSLSPQAVLDLGSGTGKALPALAARFPQAWLLALDLVPEMLARARERVPGAGLVCADAACLPLAGQSVDLVFSSLVLHWAPDIARAVTEARRVLRHPGLFCLATLGPDSYGELRSAWAEADRYSHVLAFPEMHNLGDALVRAGFAEPVLATEHLTLTYPDLPALVRDLRVTGTGNATAGRNRGLTSPRTWARMAAAYERFRTPEGRLPATIEVLFAVAWVPDPAARRAGPEEQSFPISRLGLRG